MQTSAQPSRWATPSRSSPAAQRGATGRRKRDEGTPRGTAVCGAAPRMSQALGRQPEPLDLAVSAPMTPDVTPAMPPIRYQTLPDATPRHGTAGQGRDILQMVLDHGAGEVVLNVDDADDPCARSCSSAPAASGAVRQPSRSAGRDTLVRPPRADLASYVAKQRRPGVSGQRDAAGPDRHTRTSGHPARRPRLGVHKASCCSSPVRHSSTTMLASSCSWSAWWVSTSRISRRSVSGAG